MLTKTTRNSAICTPRLLELVDTIASGLVTLDRSSVARPDICGITTCPRATSTSLGPAIAGRAPCAEGAGEGEELEGDGEGEGAAAEAEETSVAFCREAGRSTDFPDWLAITWLRC